MFVLSSLPTRPRPPPGAPRPWPHGLGFRHTAGEKVHANGQLGAPRDTRGVPLAVCTSHDGLDELDERHARQIGFVLLQYAANIERLDLDVEEHASHGLLGEVLVADQPCFCKEPLPLRVAQAAHVARDRRVPTLQPLGITRIDVRRVPALGAAPPPPSAHSVAPPPTGDAPALPRTFPSSRDPPTPEWM